MLRYLLKLAGYLLSWTAVAGYAACNPFSSDVTIQNQFMKLKNNHSPNVQLPWLS